MQPENNPSNPTTENPAENIKKSVERPNNTLNSEKEVTVQNLQSQTQLLQSEYDMLTLKIESLMRKLSTNNNELSGIVKDEVDNYCNTIKNSLLKMEGFIKTCEAVDEEFNSIKALKLKTEYFRGICEE